MGEPVRAAMRERRAARPPATTRGAIDELVRALELMGDPLAFRELGIARGKVRKVMEMLRKMEAGR